MMLAKHWKTIDNPPLFAMVALFGPLAMILCELRQAWKGATVTERSCAGMWLIRAATLIITPPPPFVTEVMIALETEHYWLEPASLEPPAAALEIYLN